MLHGLSGRVLILADDGIVIIEVNDLHDAVILNLIYLLAPEVVIFRRIISRKEIRVKQVRIQFLDGRFLIVGDFWRE